MDDTGGFKVPDEFVEELLKAAAEHRIIYPQHTRRRDLTPFEEWFWAWDDATMTPERKQKLWDKHEESIMPPRYIIKPFNVQRNEYYEIVDTHTGERLLEIYKGKADGLTKLVDLLNEQERRIEFLAQAAKP